MCLLAACRSCRLPRASDGQASFTSPSRCGAARPAPRPTRNSPSWSTAEEELGGGFEIETASELVSTAAEFAAGLDGRERRVIATLHDEHGPALFAPLLDLGRVVRWESARDLEL